MKRAKLATALDRAGIPGLVQKLCARATSPWIPVLTYHRAADPAQPTQLDEGVIDTTPAVFERQMGYLARHFDTLSIDDVRSFRRGGSLPKKPVLVTFDDGYLDNHDVVLPILKKHGLKATFFIATWYLQERRLFWWDKINLLVKRSTRASITLQYPVAETYVIGPEPAARRKGIKRLVQVVMDRFGLDLQRFLDALAEACGVELSRDEERRIVDGLLMTWPQVKALRQAGMDVQSHTRTHRVLQNLDQHELREELGGSREVLEGVLREPVRAISYPIGKPLGAASHVRSAVRAAGYDLGFSNGTGVNHRWAFEPLDARRICLDISYSDPHFRALMAVPYITYPIPSALPWSSPKS